VYHINNVMRKISTREGRIRRFICNSETKAQQPVYSGIGNKGTTITVDYVLPQPYEPFLLCQS
jgi:hypothetical protein